MTTIAVEAADPLDCSAVSRPVLSSGQDGVVCCPPGSGKAISIAQAERLAASLKALADPTRLRLLSLIASEPAGEACVCELTEPVGLSQPTVSHHLKLLVDAGVIARTQRGRWAYYRLVPGALAAITAQLGLNE